jgi:hypothetical protein
MHASLGRTSLTTCLRVAALAAVAVAGPAASGQTLENLPLARTYGTGVHAYFSGDYDRSYEDLTAAIEAGSEDPRTRYFRGLSALRLGRLDEAEADFSEGADLEARSLGGWPVSRSLERVQGHDRLRLERHRTRARVAAFASDRAAEQRRYSEIQAAQPDVRRRRLPVELPAPSRDKADPFADQPEAVPAAPESPAAERTEPAPSTPAAELQPEIEQPAEPPVTAEAPAVEAEMPAAEAAPPAP